MTADALPTVGPLSASDLLVFDAVRRLLASRPYSPSVREIAAECGLAVITTHDHLERLRYRGLLIWNDRQPRTLRLTS